MTSRFVEVDGTLNENKIMFENKMFIEAIDQLRFVLTFVAALKGLHRADILYVINK